MTQNKNESKIKAQKMPGLGGVALNLGKALGRAVLWHLWPFGRNREITEDQYEELKEMRQWNDSLDQDIASALEQGPIGKRQYLDFRGRFNELIFKDAQRFEETGYETKLFAYMAERGRKNRERQ